MALRLADGRRLVLGLDARLPARKERFGRDEPARASDVCADDFLPKVPGRTEGGRALPGAREMGANAAAPFASGDPPTRAARWLARALAPLPGADLEGRRKWLFGFYGALGGTGDALIGQGDEALEAARRLRVLGLSCGLPSFTAKTERGWMARFRPMTSDGHGRLVSVPSCPVASIESVGGPVDAVYIDVEGGGAFMAGEYLAVLSARLAP